MTPMSDAAFEALEKRVRGRIADLVCKNCGAQVPDTEPQYYFCNSECERDYDDE